MHSCAAAVAAVPAGVECPRGMSVVPRLDLHTPGSSISSYKENSEQQSIINIIAVCEDDLENETHLCIAQAYQCDAVKEVFDTLYAGSFLAAWKSHRKCPMPRPFQMALASTR